MKIKEGAIWRSKKDHVKCVITTITDNLVSYKWPDDSSWTLPIHEFEVHFELVTIDNIAAGDYVVTLKRDEYFTFPLGVYEVLNHEAIGLYIQHDNYRYLFGAHDDAEYLEPCIPPMKPNDDGTTEKTYSNSEIMQMLEDGRFIEGDEIVEVGGHRFVYKEHFFEGENGTIFEKGDRWIVEWIEKFEECTREYVTNVIISDMSVHGVGDPGDWDHIEVKYIDERMKLMQWLYNMHKGAKSAFTLACLISDGTWYKKVKRGV